MKKKTKPKRVAIYIRVSTVDQKIDLQKDGLERFCQHAEYEITHTYVDVGYSGKKVSRPEFNKMMNEARKRKFDIIAVWKFDRFARSISQLVNALNEFNHLGIDFVSVQDKIDTSSPLGKLMFTLVGAFAEFESNLIGERVKAGMAASKKKGIKMGRKKTSAALIKEIENLATTTNLSINKIRDKIENKASRAVIGKIVKSIRDQH